MATPVEGYYLDGKRVPSVTTILRSLGWSKDALMIWAHRQGLEGLDFRTTTKDAADAGTMAHEMIEAFIQGRQYDPPWPVDAAVLGQAETAYGAFLEWFEDSKLQVVATEVRMVSPTLRVGGTADWIALRGKKGLCLPDVKTSGRIYAEAVIQVAAYGAIFEETTGLQLDSYAICRFDKEHGGFTHKWLPRAAMEPALKAFLDLRDLHDRKGQVERLAQ